MDEELKNLAVLIPAYKPGGALVTLCEELKERGFGEVVVVDDGSGESYGSIFGAVEGKGCRVLRHVFNMGKGRALKTGFNDILVNCRGVRGVVTADADGQHLVKDIINVGRAVLQREDTIIIGGRTFSGKVPLKSRFGNTVTRNVFRFVSGQNIRDTQSGLRGFPLPALKKIITLKGERYEYEMNMLLEASRFDLKLKEIEIETVYIDGNASSHFNAVRDSWRIYKIIIMFGASSLISFFVDAVMFALITVIFPSTAGKDTAVVWIPLLGARLVSSAVNFLINRNVIFAKEKQGSLKRHIIGYYLLAAVILAGNIAVTSLFKNLGVNLYVSYFISLLLFLVSYPVQKHWVFR